MRPSRFTWVYLCFGLGLSACLSAASAGEPVLEFIQGLRSRGYYDTALQYLDSVEEQSNIPQEIREVLSFERGQVLLDHARTLSNLTEQRKQLDASQAAFEQFVKATPAHALAGRANSSRGRILLEQARVEIWDGDKPSNEGNRDLFRQAARNMIQRAREIFNQAVDQHGKAVAAYPNYIPPEEKVQREARARSEAEYIEAQLDLAQCTYWEAQTYDRGDAKRKELLTNAATEFEEIHSKYRSMTGGLFARMWQGKCFEEQDEIGIALGLYEEILGHGGTSGTMRNLKDRALRFRLICLNHEKRKDYRLVVLEGEEWLREARNRSRTEVGLGIQYEISRAHETIGTDRTTPEAERINALNQALNRARTISRFPGELKTPSTAMIQRLMVALNRDPGDPKDFETANGNANVLFEQMTTLNTEVGKLLAAGKSKEALETRESLRATAAETSRMYDLALRMVRSDTNPILVNIARLRLSYALFLQEKYFDAAVIAEHQMVKFGEEFPEVGLEAGFIAMTAFDHAYTHADPDNRRFEGEMVARVANKIAERWPESDRANDARNAVARIHFNSGNLLEAAEWYNKIPEGTPMYAQAQVSAGKAYWRHYVIEANKPDEELPSGENLNAWKAAAVKHLETGLNEAQKGIPADKGLSDDLVGAKLSLVSIRNLDGLYSGKKDGPPGALELLTQDPHPVLKQVDVAEGEARPKDPSKAKSREMASLAYQQLLRAHIGQRNLEEARTARLKLEEVAGKDDAAALTQVYIAFGRELEQELDRLKAANETQRLTEVRSGFESFLNDLSSREDGQTFYSLLWIAETFTSLADGSREDAAKSQEYFSKAAEAYQKILDNVAGDASFVSEPGQIIGTKLRLASSLRRQPDFAKAEEVILDILKSNPNALDAQFEAASLYQDWGKSGTSDPISRYQMAVAGTKEGAPVTVWGWAKMAQFLQRELFSKKDERLEKLHFDARYRLAQTQREWGLAESNLEKSTDQLRRAQASIAGFQRISNRWPDEEYQRFNALYREILSDLGSPVVDLPRDLDGKTPAGGEEIAQQTTGGPGTGGGTETEAETSSSKQGGANTLLMVVMILFGGGAVAGLYFMAVGQNKKKYAQYASTRPATPRAEPEVTITFPVGDPAPAKSAKTAKVPAGTGISIKTDAAPSASPPAKAPVKPAQAPAEAGAVPAKRKPTEEEIKRARAIRAAKAKAEAAKAEAQKQKPAQGAQPPKPRKKPEG